LSIFIGIEVFFASVIFIHS